MSETVDKIKKNKRLVIGLTILGITGVLLYQKAYDNGMKAAYADICDVVTKEKLSEFIFRNSHENIKILMKLL